MPKRRFWQIHLSTAVVLMFVAGVLVWANVREERSSPIPQHAFRTDFYVAIKQYGWPFVCREETWNYPKFSYMRDGGWIIENLFGDALIALAILLSICVACEWRIRRRAAKIVNSVQSRRDSTS